MKKEICDQTEVLLRNEHILKNDTTSIDQLKDIMKRILRLDTYLQQSLPHSNQQHLFPHKENVSLSTNQQSISSLLTNNGLVNNASKLAYMMI